jgi:hypothetical protein
MQFSELIGFEGVSLAYFVTYSIYLAAMYYFIIHKPSVAAGPAEA